MFKKRLACIDEEIAYIRSWVRRADNTFISRQYSLVAG